MRRLARRHFQPRLLRGTAASFLRVTQVLLFTAILFPVFVSAQSFPSFGSRGTSRTLFNITPGQSTNILLSQGYRLSIQYRPEVQIGDITRPAAYGFSVIDSSSGNPVDGARVSIPGREVIQDTGATTYYDAASIENVQRGRITVDAGPNNRLLNDAQFTTGQPSQLPSRPGRFEQPPPTQQENPLIPNPPQQTEQLPPPPPVDQGTPQEQVPPGLGSPFTNPYLPGAPDDEGLVPCGSELRPCQLDDLRRLFTNVFNYLMLIGGAAALLALIVAGMKYIIGVLQGADEGTIREAKQNLTYAIVGLFVLLLAYVIVRTIVVVILGFQGDSPF